MTEKRIKQIEQSGLNGTLSDAELRELITTIRELKRPLAELLGPTIETLEVAAKTCRRFELNVCVGLLETELTHLRAICASEKGTK